MPLSRDIEDAYHAIGEFIVFFQSVEDLYRQIGWFILDPEKTAWPPREFRSESNSQLVDKVTDLFVGLTEKYEFPNGPQKANDARNIRIIFHHCESFAIG